MKNSNNSSLLYPALDSGAKAGAENVINRAINSLVDFVKKKYGEVQVTLGSCFTRYLENADKRYNKVRTLATGNDPRSIIGSDSIYVNIGVEHNGKKIDTNTVDRLLKISNNILILGTGGIGKSMLMRYLFLRTARSHDYVPVFLELRKTSNQDPGNISIFELVYSCMQDFDVELPKEQFGYSLQSGKYLFLMDGFDEVKEALSAETAYAIQSFCAKYPNNPCIITSRPGIENYPFETFTTVSSLPLSKEQAIELASKIWKEDEKTREFCKQLNDSLYEEHKDFAENPLLLSMMFLTFMRNNSIPNYLADFYKKSYEALYNAHDSTDKGYYIRDFKCKNLEENKFRQILSHFCFQSYFKEQYEFSEKEIKSYLQKTIEKLDLGNVSAKDYLKDLRNAVCIIIKDGDVYKFSHRSFQAYFAAVYTSLLKDEEQSQLFNEILSNSLYYNMQDYYELLYQIEPERFCVNTLEKGLRKFQKEYSSKRDPDLFILKATSQAVMIESFENGKDVCSFHIPGDDKCLYYFNIFAMFERWLFNYDQKKLLNSRRVSNIKEIKEYYLANAKSQNDELTYFQIDRLAEDDRQKLYAAIINIRQITAIRESINMWLEELDKKRNFLKLPSFIESL